MKRYSCVVARVATLATLATMVTMATSMTACLGDGGTTSESDTPDLLADDGGDVDATDTNEGDLASVDAFEVDADKDTHDSAVEDTRVADTGPDSSVDDTVADTQLVDTAVADTTVADTAVEDTADTVADIPVESLPKFSFFVTSYEAMIRLSGSNNGFGGDLRFGEETGLAGADKICTTIAEDEMPGAGQKIWHAYLSVKDDGTGASVNAIDRIGTGPWYDRNARLVAQDKTGLTTTRPNGDAAIKNDLPNERGESQKNQPGSNGQGTADNHDILTGSNAQGKLDSNTAANTCNNWTSTTVAGRPRLGHSWPAQSGQGWQTAHQAAGCAAVVNLIQNGPGSQGCSGVGCGGGYGAIYCFAETP